MARPVAAPALHRGALDLTVGPAVIVLLALLAGVAWPVGAVVVAGAAGPAAAGLPGAALATLVVALDAALAGLLVAGVLAYALTRVGVPGGDAAWRLLRLGVLVPPFVAPLALLVLGAPGGLPTIAAAQALAFLPHATVLLVRALAVVPRELEQVAETLGAPRRLVLRRVTLALAGPPLRATAFTVLGLCVADVAAPLLLGGRVAVLAALAVAGTAAPASAALALLGLAVSVALGGAAWRRSALAAQDTATLPRIDRRAPDAVRWSLGAVVWLTAGGLAGLWAIVPLGSLLRSAGGAWVPSLEHWAALATPAGRRAVGGSLALGVVAALAGSLLALAAAWTSGRLRTPLAPAIGALARVPAGVPGVVAGAGWLLAFGPPSSTLAGLLLAMVPLVACWSLPVVLGAARRGLALIDPAAEAAAQSLGADRVTTLRRIVAPALAPVVGGMLTASFAGGVLALGVAVGLLGPGPAIGTLWMLALAASGAPGAACAVATVLLAAAGGAVLLGRALAGRTWMPTLFA
jgi:iron(III) transport system permease protein